MSATTKTTTKMSTVTTLKVFRKKEEPEILPDKGTPLYISQWKIDKKKKTCSVLENMEAKARTFTETALTKDGEKKKGPKTGEENFPVQVRCMRHPTKGSNEEKRKEQIGNALSFDVWYQWLTHKKKNILTKEKFNGTVILDYHGIVGIQMKIPLSWKINKKDNVNVKAYKADLNKYCNEKRSCGEEGMNWISPIHIYHFFLRPMFDQGYDIKKVVFLGCYSASIAKLIVDPMQSKNAPGLYYSMVTEMASVLKRYNRYGVTVYGMPQVFMAKTQGGIFRLTSGAEHGQKSEEDWKNYKKVEINNYREMTKEDRDKIQENLVSMKSDDGRDWILGVCPTSTNQTRVYDKDEIEKLNMDDSSADSDLLKQNPKFDFYWELQDYVEAYSDDEDDDDDDDGDFEYDEDEAEEYSSRYVDFEQFD